MSECRYCKKELELWHSGQMGISFCSKDCYDLMIAEVVRSARGEKE
jgi:hypothetical protein